MPIILSNDSPQLVAHLAANAGQFQTNRIIQGDTQRAGQLSLQEQLARQQMELQAGDQRFGQQMAVTQTNLDYDIARSTQAAQQGQFNQQQTAAADNISQQRAQIVQMRDSGAITPEQADRWQLELMGTGRVSGELTAAEQTTQQGQRLQLEQTRQAGQTNRAAQTQDRIDARQSTRPTTTASYARQKAVIDDKVSRVDDDVKRLADELKGMESVLKGKPAPGVSKEAYKAKQDELSAAQTIARQVKDERSSFLEQAAHSAGEQAQEEPPEGTAIKNRATGEVLIYQGGKWIPAQSVLNAARRPAR